MDEAGLRRGSVSANARWGNTVAILVGDLLFARASDIVADLGPEFVRLQARTFSRLVQGQIAETVGPGPGQDPLDHYLKVVADKTGSLIATSALFGAKLSAAAPQVQQVMADFGEQIGVDLPAQRRHHRHHQRRDRQDARAPTSARASRPCRPCWPARRPIPPTRGCSSSSTPTSAPTRPWPRPWRCSAATAASTRPAPTSAVAPTSPA